MSVPRSDKSGCWPGLRLSTNQADRLCESFLQLVLEAPGRPPDMFSPIGHASIESDIRSGMRCNNSRPGQWFGTLRPNELKVVLSLLITCSNTVLVSVGSSLAGSHSSATSSTAQPHVLSGRIRPMKFTIPDAFLRRSLTTSMRFLSSATKTVCLKRMPSSRSSTR